MEANIAVDMSPLRIGTGALPASRLKVTLVPVPTSPKVVGHTRCGQPITAPFDRGAYDRDEADGVFHTSGSMFGGQVMLDDLRVTRQRSKSAAGSITFDKLDLGALAKLSSHMGSSSIAPAGSVSGSLRIEALPMHAPERSRAVLTLNKLELAASGSRLTLHESTPPMAMADDRLVVPAVALEFVSAAGLHGTVSLGGEVRKLSTSPELALGLRLAPMGLAALTSVIPRLDRATGTVEASLNVSGKVSAPVYAGEAHIQRGELSFRGLDMPLTDVNVDVSVGGGEVRIVRGGAEVGGGTVSFSGEAPIKGLEMGTATIVVTARGIHMSPADGVKLALDADLTASLPEASSAEEERPIPRVEGDVILTSFSYTRPIAMSADIGSLTQRSRRKVFETYDPSDDGVSFDIRVKSREPLRLRNNLLDAQLALDPQGLAFTGTNQRYGLRGQMRILPAGRIRFRTSEFEIRQGYVRFDDADRVAPNVDVTAVTDYRRYSETLAGAAGAGGAGAAGAGASGGVGRTGGTWRITLHAFGDADDLRLELTSEPALSQEDIVLLLTLGMTRAEIDQLQASNLGGTAALEALSAFTGADSAVKKAVPIIDDFGFGSAYSSRTGRTEPTITVGKRVTDKLRANVTSGLSENREIRSNLEWRLTPRVSVQGSYDNVNDVSSSSLGNLGADVRWRLEFE
jgi:translocation and assembly module TamB